MAHVRKGMLVPSPQWWKHLRDWKSIFWKKHRMAEKNAIRCSGEMGRRRSAKPP